MRKNGIISLFVFCICLSYEIMAQPSPSWQIEKDYTCVELKLLLKSSNGKAVVFDEKRDMKLSSSDKHNLASFYNLYSLGSYDSRNSTLNSPRSIEEMECFYELIYENHIDDYIDRIKDVLVKTKLNVLPNCMTERSYFRMEDNVEFICLPVDTVCFRYWASDNIVYEKRKIGYSAERIETPCFVPIGDLEIVFTEGDKVMRVAFELYDYKKLGFSRPKWKGFGEEWPHIDLFMEIQFQEGDFVVTDESFPNLIRRW